jgi:hypothetical protein
MPHDSRPAVISKGEEIVRIRNRDPFLLRDILELGHTIKSLLPLPSTSSFLAPSLHRTMNKSREVSPSSSAVLRSAAVINNIAVSLLQKRCYNQAMDTLKDSLSVLKLSTTTAEDARLSYTLRANMEQKAMLRLARPVPMCSSSQASMCLESVSSVSLLQAAASETTPLHHAFCIHIDDPSTFSSDFPEQELAIMSSTVLYNYAIACLCLGKIAKRASVRDNLKKGVLRLSMAACAVLRTAPDMTHHGGYRVSAMLMETITLRNLVTHATVPDALSSKLVHLQNLIRRIHASDSLGQEPTAAAA